PVLLCPETVPFTGPYIVNIRPYFNDVTVRIPASSRRSEYGPYMDRIVRPGVIIQKLDELNNNMMKIDNRIGELVRKTDKLEKFMVEKIESDMENLKRIQMIEMISEANKRDISSLLDTVHYMAQFLLKLNVDQNGRTNDADFKYNLEGHCTQLAKCVEKKPNPKK
ncbi:unnamed protein product, partial [Didymodactylos carnosus]